MKSYYTNSSKHRYDWRQDATYPAAVVRVLNMHLYSIVDEIDGVNWSYHANDNAFLNYGDQWFSQRTLVARFMMNESVSRFGKKGDVVEVLPNFSLELVHLSGIYNSNTIGHSKTHSESNENVELSWKRTSAECERDAERVEGFGTHDRYGSV